jgi:hypothetical protein
MTDENKTEQASFVQSLRDLAEKHAASNPVLNELRMLNQRLVAEARRRLREQGRVVPFGGFVDEVGAVTVLDARDDVTVSADSIMEALRRLAREGKIRAASVCVIVDRPVPAGETPIQFVQLHSEHRTGLALLGGVPADEKVIMQGVPGVKGPAIAVYQRKVPPAIFVK